ncbi:MAG: hypothetical protein ABFS86_12990 [Planctomycetota bacterium]
MSLLTVAGFLLLCAALVIWLWCAWTNWWIADLHERPERELDVAFDVAPGAHSTARFTPSAGLPHVLFVEFEAGLPGPAGEPCPIEVEWSAAAGGEVLARADGAPHRWHTGEPGMGIVWLGRFDAVRDEEHVFTVRVIRGLPGATARLQTVWDHDVLENARILVALLSMVAWAPGGLGLMLLLIAWFRRSFRIRRRS